MTVGAEALEAARSRIGARPESHFDAELPDRGAQQRFDEDGYLVLGAVTDAAELAWLERFYDTVFEQRIGGVPGGYLDLAAPYNSEVPATLPQVLLPELVLPELAQTNFVRNAAAIGSLLLGVSVEKVRVDCHLICKPAGTGAATPWHQDEAYWDPAVDHRAVSMWMPLEDADAESGCLSFLPGTHHGPIVEHRHIGDDESVHGLVAPGIDDSGAVTCPVPAGSATVHRSRTMHAAGANVSDHARRACIAVVQAEPTPRTAAHDRPWLSSGHRTRNPTR